MLNNVWLVSTVLDSEPLSISTKYSTAGKIRMSQIEALFPGVGEGTYETNINSNNVRQVMILAKCRERKAVQGREKVMHKERLVVKLTNI